MAADDRTRPPGIPRSTTEGVAQFGPLCEPDADVQFTEDDDRWWPHATAGTTREAWGPVKTERRLLLSVETDRDALAVLFEFD